MERALVLNSEDVGLAFLLIGLMTLGKKFNLCKSMKWGIVRIIEISNEPMDMIVEWYVSERLSL